MNEPHGKPYVPGHRKIPSERRPETRDPWPLPCPANLLVQSRARPRNLPEPAPTCILHPLAGAAGMEASPWAACTIRWARWDREATVSRVTVAPHEKCIHCRAYLGLAVCRESTAVLIAGRGVAESRGCEWSLEGGGPGGEPAATSKPFLPLRLAGWSRLCSVPADSGAPATTWLRCQARRL